MNKIQECFTNRELSWLKFNERVLNEAGNARVPLAERLTFASIYQSNLDEFFRVRVGTLMMQMNSKEPVRENKTGMTSEEQVREILKQVNVLEKKKAKIYEQLMGELEPKGIHIINFNKLSNAEGKMIEQYFDAHIAPFLSPMIIGRQQPFPFLANQQLYAIVLLTSQKGKKKTGIVPCSNSVFKRLIEIPTRPGYFMLSEELILHFVSKLYPKYTIREKSILRVTRNADIDAGGIYDEDKTENSFKGSLGGETIRVLSGSENQGLSDILKECASKTGVTIEMIYKGSVDIMQELEEGAEDYDTVWPASTLWISLGDKQHLVKYNQSISASPVVFGVRESLAKKLNLMNREVSVKELLEDIRQGKLTFCMTSATQSNSGASAYIGFLYALLGKSEGLTEEDLDDPKLQQNISELLSGVERSSGSSDWLKDMFISGDFDAMVNYESLIIDANQQLAAEGKEPLYVVYPYDGLSLSDSPFGYVDHGDSGKQEAFQKVQEYLLSEPVQSEIEGTGRRTNISGISKEHKDVFNADWGIDTDRILSPISMPSEKVLRKALNNYQTSFRKPSLNVYCLDYSGSMYGEGNSQLVEAMGQVLLQENARKNLLQASEGEVNIIITFDSEIKNIYTSESAEATDLEQLYFNFSVEEPDGGTDMYLALEEGLG